MAGRDWLDKKVAGSVGGWKRGQLEVGVAGKGMSGVT